MERHRKNKCKYCDELIDFCSKYSILKVATTGDLNEAAIMEQELLKIIDRIYKGRKNNG